MPLNYQEANLFLRAGDDMRREAFPPGDFLRITPPNRPITGYQQEAYTPTNQDLSATDWRRA